MTRQSESDQHPPVPPLVFRVGVTGHRPNRLRGADPQLLARQVDSVLQAVASGARAGESTQLVLMTSLAEGADRIAAHSALALRFDLAVVLPMPAAQYEADFLDEASREEFRKLLKGRRVFTLPAPETEDRTPCYMAASNILLNQCDLLLALWDCQPSQGPGGTTDTLDKARERGVPTVMISVTTEASISFQNAGDPLEAVRQEVGRVLFPVGDLKKDLQVYRTERWPSRTPATAYLALRLFAERRLKMPPRPRRDYTTATVRLPDLLTYYRWVDTLAVYYGERSRSASLHLQVLATLSVVAVLANITFGSNEVAAKILASTEAVCLLLLFVSIFQVRHGKWHQRWLRYRATAEQLRCVDLLAPLGLAATQSLQYGAEQDQQAQLMPWLIRRIEAAHCLENTVVDDKFLRNRVRHLRDVLNDQIGFQGSSAHRYREAEEFLHSIGLVFFCLAAVLALYHLLYDFHRLPPAMSEALERNTALKHGLSALAAMLPALGAAAAATVAQGEYKRLAERSKSVCSSLKRLLDKLPSEKTKLSLARVSTSCLSATQVLSGEVRDWSDMFASRPPSLP